ncbi:MAG: SpoVG family protein [Planctomycetota bacterium]
MEITEIRIKLMEGSEDRLRAFCSITVDQCFVIRDLKIIDGTHGPFVAMPSRKLTGHCGRCGQKNHLRATFCNGCGAKLTGLSSGNEPPQKLYADVAHPINSQCREMIQDAVITEFEAELNRSQQPGYRSRYDDDFDAGDYDESDYHDASKPPASSVTSDAESNQVANDGFGAGVLDDVVPDPIRRTVNHNTVARGDRAPAHPTVPKPHFKDRRDGGRSGTASTHSPSGQGAAGRSHHESDERSADGDNDSFGAGIFD